MITFVKDIKSAFIALSPRSNGLPLGRTSFQDFEIAFFLNLAYTQLFGQRVKQLMDMVNHEFAADGRTPRRDVTYGPLINELGTLYRSTVHVPDWNPLDMPFARYNLLWDNELSHIFEIVPINGFLPYIIGCDLFENFYVQGLRRGGPNNARKTINMSVTYPVRILNETEVLEHSLLLRRDPTILPYRVGRIRADLQFSFVSALETALNYLDSILKTLSKGQDPLSSMVDRNQGRQQVYLLELLHNKKYSNSVLTCSMQQIVHPEPISEQEITYDSTRQVEVAFGFEIAELAAQLAAGKLGGQAPLGPPQQQQQQ